MSLFPPLHHLTTTPQLSQIHQRSTLSFINLTYTSCIPYTLLNQCTVGTSSYINKLSATQKYVFLKWKPYVLTLILRALFLSKWNNFSSSFPLCSFSPSHQGGFLSSPFNNIPFKITTLQQLLKFIVVNLWYYKSEHFKLKR